MKKLKEVKEKLKNNIFFKIFKGIMYAFVVLLIFVIIVQKVSNNSLSVGGFRVFMVVSGSMVDEYNIGDILISKRTDAEDIDVGDNVTYLGEKSNLKDLIVTHKVIHKEVRDGQTYFITKGVANNIPDPEISYSQVYGKVVYKTAILSLFGKLMNNRVVYYITFMLVAIIISVEIISSMFSSKDENDGKE